MEYLADTVAIVRHMRMRHMGSQAAEILDEADLGLHTVHLSAITLMEVLYLSEGKRIDLRLSELVDQVLGSSNYPIVPIGREVVVVAEEIDDVPELHDRILVATAKWLDVPILLTE